MTSFTWSRTFNGAPAIGSPVKGPGTQIYAGGGQSGSNTASATEQVKFTGTWTPNPNLASDPAPPSVIFEINTQAESDTIVNGTVTPGTDAENGRADPISAHGIATGTHYRVETGGSFTETLDLHASATNSSGFAYAAVGGISVSIVNGNWDGPYYFHHGEYDDGVNDTPWANDTVGTTPSITDVSDSVNSFSLHSTAGGQAYVKGSITPVWFWNGPDLGVPPPPFEITVSTGADCNDNSGNATATYTLDGIDNNPHNVGSTGEQDLGSEDVAVQVQSDEYAPGEGDNGYWAIGPTIDLYASIFGNSPSNLESSVDLDASIESGLNN